MILRTKLKLGYNTTIYYCRARLRSRIKCWRE